MKRCFIFFKSIFIWILCICTIIKCFAATRVIATLGRTESTTPYLEKIMQMNGEQKLVETAQPTTYEMNYVVYTKELTPGTVKCRKVDFKNFTQPIYIVGDDDLSKKWVKQYADRLKALKATGFIVNVKSNESYLNFTKELGFNPVPINGKEMAENFGFKHYPVLISQHLIEQ